MGEQYDNTNLPTLPDGSPNPDFQWKAPPGYTGPSPQEQELAQGLGYQQGAGYGQGTQSILDALGKGGGYSAIMPHLGKLADFMKKGGAAADKYETAATKQLQQTGQQAFKGIQAQMGGQGALGSTTHLGGLGDLGAKYAGERANIGATAAGMKESNMMNRMQAGVQGLSALGSQRSYEQMNELSGGQSLANLSLQQSGMQHGMAMDQLGVLDQQRMQPAEWAYQNWRGNQQAPKSGGAAPWILGGAQAYAAANGVPTNFNQGGGSSYQPGDSVGGKTWTRKGGY